VKIAVIQLTSRADYRENLKKIDELVACAKAQAADLEAIFLPECFYFMSDGRSVGEIVVGQEGDGLNHYENIRNIAIKHKLFVLGGSANTVENGRIYNRSYNFSPEGTDLGHYDKMNLFSCDLGGNVEAIDESKIYQRGISPKMVIAGALKIGLSICFDLRFPELYRHYMKAGANLLSISSAFTVATGRAHWHTLVRARAIENQCFVVATDQWGVHNDRIKTFGHSLIVDPWGEILADAGEGEVALVAEINLDKVARVRKIIKVI